MNTLLVVTVSVLALAACSSDGSSAPSPSGSPASASSVPATTASTPGGTALPSGDPSTVGADAEAILATTFTGRPALGGGYGALQPDIGNTLADTPKRVLSLTFAFVCTGAATVHLSVGADTADSSANGTFRCDESVNQLSVKLAQPGPVSFRATVNGGARDGTFAFGYYPEKTQS